MKLPLLSATEIIKALEQAGFRVIRQKGSHISLYKRSDAKTHLVVVPNNSTSEQPDFRKRFIGTTSSAQARLHEPGYAKFGGGRDSRGHYRFFGGCSQSYYAGMVVL